jgi:hypothetical protein
MTQLPKYYPDMDRELTKRETRFYNWFTLYKNETFISPLRIFCACSLVVCEECKFIYFNLPPEEPKKKIEKVEGLDLGSLLASKCLGYEEQFLVSEDSSGFYKLERLCSGHCYICDRTHDKSNAFILSKARNKPFSWIVIELKRNI